MRVDEAQLRVGRIQLQIRDRTIDVAARCTSLVAGHAGCLYPLHRVHEAAGEGDLVDIRQSRVMARAAIHDAPGIDRAFDAARGSPVKAVIVAEPLAGMAGCADRGDLFFSVPVAERLSRSIGMGRAEPVGDGLVVLDLDIGGLERTGLRQGERDVSLAFRFLVGNRTVLPQHRLSAEEQYERGCGGQHGAGETVGLGHGTSPFGTLGGDQHTPILPRMTDDRFAADQGACTGVVLPVRYASSWCPVRSYGAVPHATSRRSGH